MIELIKAYGRYDHRLFSMDWSTGIMSCLLYTSDAADE